MHLVDKALTAGRISGPEGLVAWASLDIPYTDPDSIRLTRTLLRPTEKVMNSVTADMPSFLAEYGYDKHDDIARAAWTEDLTRWQFGMSSELEAPDILSYISWVAEGPDGGRVRERLEVIALTNTQALVTLHLGGSHTHIPMWAGIITRERSTQSLALLLSKKQNPTVPLAALYSELETSLPWAETIRLAFASERMYLPDVFTMDGERLIELLGRAQSVN